MLFKKLKNRKHCREKTIGILGVHNGAGVTYTGLLLANFISDELEKKTAFIECNENQDFRLLQNAYEWQEVEEDRFTFQQISFYKSVRENQVVDFRNDKFGCYIYDYGTKLDENSKEFIRCDKKLVICGGAVWNKRKLKKFIEQAKSISGSSDWIYLIPFADKKEIIRLRKELARDIYAVPMVQDPFYLSKEIYELFQHLFL